MSSQGQDQVRASIAEHCRAKLRIANQPAFDPHVRAILYKHGAVDQVLEGQVEHVRRAVSKWRKGGKRGELALSSKASRDKSARRGSVAAAKLKRSKRDADPFRVEVEDRTGLNLAGRVKRSQRRASAALRKARGRKT